ncbi:hypothetical protein [Mycobacterium gordonae]|nr:hypothetical protein [Mycobacterium gordonae]
MSILDVDCIACGEDPVSDIERMLCDGCVYAVDFLGDLADNWD